MSELIARARGWIEEKRAEIQKLEDLVRQHEESHQAIIEMMGEPETSAASIGGAIERTSSTSEIIAETEKILEEAREPMSGAAVLRELESRGITVSGKDPLNNLSTRLSREAARPDGRIRSMGRGQGYVVTPRQRMSLKELMHRTQASLGEENPDDSPI